MLNCKLLFSEATPADQMREVVPSSRRDFFSVPALGFHSNNDRRTISLYGSPLHMRKERWQGLHDYSQRIFLREMPMVTQNPSTHIFCSVKPSKGEKKKFSNGPNRIFLSFGRLLYECND